MKTVDGGTYRSAMATGFEAFAEWDAPWTSVNESYEAEATTYYTSSGWTFEDFKAEIGAGYPIHLGIRGHSVLALGWWDQRSLGDPGDYGYICHTTWSGWGLTQWRWDGTGGGPSSLLWETLLADYPTVGDPFCTLTVEIPNVLVPDTLTWTVNRLDYNYGAGLPHFDPPAVGSSGDFYWLFDGRDWRMRESGGPDNFGARIEAVPEPATLSLLAFGALTAIRRKR